MTGRRLEARDGQVVERGQPIKFRFDGRTYEGYSGDTVTSALTAAGVSILSRSFKYHRPRGLLCGALGVALAAWWSLPVRSVECGRGNGRTGRERGSCGTGPSRGSCDQAMMDCLR